MKSPFATRMSMLRREKDLSQRHAAAMLGISQALLSHYENGAREPKFDFVVHACDFFGVTADYLLGRTNQRKSNAEIIADNVREIITSLEILKVEETELISKLTTLIEDVEKND